MKLGKFSYHLFNELTILLTLIWSITTYVCKLPQVPGLTQIVSLLATTNAIENNNLVSFQSVSSPFSFLIIYFNFGSNFCHYEEGCSLFQKLIRTGLLSSRRESVLSGETFGLIVEEKGASNFPFTGRNALF